MEDRQQWLSMAAVVLVIAGLGFFLYQRSRQVENEGMIGDSAIAEEKANQLLDQLNIELPENLERANLSDVSGGDGTGIATRSYEDGSFEHSVIAGLPDPEAGTFYEGWLVREEPFDVVYTGKLRIAKGGYILDYNSGADLSDHEQVIVTQETVDDQKPEQHVLEGSF